MPVPKKQQDPRKDREMNVEEIECHLREAAGLCSMVCHSLVDSDERNTVAGDNWYNLARDIDALKQRARRLAR